MMRRDPSKRAERASALIREGDEHRRRRDLEAAGRCWQQAADLLLPLVEKSPRGLPPECYRAAATSLWRLASLAERRHDQRAAASQYAKALDIDEAGLPPSRDTAYLARSAGRCWGRAGNAELALTYAQRAVELRQTAEPGSLQVARDLNDVGRAHLARGTLDDALRAFTQALEIAMALEPDGDDAAAALNNLGQVHWKRGNPARGLENHLRALRIDEALHPGSPEHATSLNNVGLMYRFVGDLDEAERHYEHALAIDQAHDPDSPATVRDRTNLARLYGEREARRNRPPPRMDPSDWHASGLAIHEMSEQLTAVAERMPGSREHAFVLIAMGDALRLLRNAQEPARQYYMKAQQVVKAGGFGSDIAVTVEQNLARVASSPDEAIDRWSASIAAVESLRLNVGSPQARRELFSEHQEPYQAIVSALHTRGAPGDAARALSYAERARARALVEILGRAQAHESDTLLQETGLREREAALVQEVARFYNKTKAVPANVLAGGTFTRWEPDTGNGVERLRMLEDELEQVRMRIRDLAPERGPAAPAGSIEEIQRSLPADAVALVYAAQPDQAFMWTVTRGALSMVAIPLAVTALTKLVDQALAGYDRPVQTDRGIQPASDRPHDREGARRKLSALLLDGCPPSVWQSTRQVIIAPDGPLYRLPFEMLNLDDGPLGETHTVSYVPSLHAFELLGKRATRAERPPDRLLLGVGNPRFASGDEPLDGTAVAMQQFVQRGLRLSALPGTDAEVKLIASVFGPAATTVTGAAATEATVTELIGEYRYVHFATHGIIDDEEPLYSGLALAPTRADERGEPGRERDDFLQAHEISMLTITADVVVCSACQTGVGRYLAGEGLLSLSHAFFSAGAASVVVSLWPVPDLLTAKLMHRFYERLHHGDGAAAALRAAKQDLRRRHPDPYYWAAFVCFGRDVVSRS